MRYLINFSYDGTNFNGYQKQPDKNTIEDSIEEALKLRFNKDITIYASGRTDAKVHAINQYAHFDVDEELDLDKLKIYLNDKVKDGIFIKNITKVDNEFNARFSVKTKTYKYVINNKYDLFKRNYEMFYDKEINIDKLKEASSLFIGEHNFENFTTIQDKKESYIRVVKDIKIDKTNEFVVIYITGLGFLRYMVRNIVGCLLAYSEEKITKQDIINMLENKTDMKPVKVSPSGLYLYDVEY